MSEEIPEKDKERFFLEQGNIFEWDRPVREGFIRMPQIYPGSTELVEQLGSDYFNKTFGSFWISASATKYLADIDLANDDWFNEETKEREPQRMVLFSGGITIYKQGVIPGTEITGYDAERNGLIWTVRNPEKIFLSENGLENMIFEGCNNIPKNIERIQTILDTYQHQEDSAREAESKRDSSNFNSAFYAGQREGPGFRGGGAC